MVHSVAASGHSAAQPTLLELSHKVAWRTACLERCTGRGGRLGVQHMLGGLVRGDVTVRRAAREATQGEV